MFLHEAKQIPRTYILLRPCSPGTPKKVLSRFNLKLRAGAKLDAFQRAVIVFTNVLCRRRWRRRPCC